MSHAVWGFSSGREGERWYGDIRQLQMKWTEETRFICVRFNEGGSEILKSDRRGIELWLNFKIFVFFLWLINLGFVWFWTLIKSYY